MNDMSPDSHVVKTAASCCYFSITQPSTIMPSSTTSSIDTPLTSPTFDDDLITPDPTHPLLASRLSQMFISEYSKGSSAPRMDGSKVLQLQTQAAHSTPARPQPRPLQDMFHIADDTEQNSDDSINSNASDDSMSPDEASSMLHARCSRCQRSASTDLTTGGSNMIQWGLNSFYCTRCAKIVGFGHR